MSDRPSEDQRISDAVIHELKQVIDPELGVPITDLQLVDEVDITGHNARVSFHLTMPFCPDELVIMMADDIHRRLSTIEGIDRVEVVVSNHVNAPKINALLKERHFGQPAA